MVSPMEMSPIPLMAMMFPTVALVTGVRARPSNWYRETALALRGAASASW